MKLIEKTVFISYRRANAPWAIAINQYLTNSGYDVFIDFWSIRSGDFEQIITQSILASAHFLVLLTPSAIERCTEPNDWLRREIEIALYSKRNIIPIFLENFDFGDPATYEYLTGDLENLRKYNGLPIHVEYFPEGMERLCNQFLDVPLDDVKHPKLHPVSSEIQQKISEQKQIISKLTPIDEKELLAQKWFERAFTEKTQETKIITYSKAIEYDPTFSSAYNNRGNSYSRLQIYDEAIKDYNKAIELDPLNEWAFNNRGVLFSEINQIEKAIKDFNQAVKINPTFAFAYNNRGAIHYELNQFEIAIEDFNKAIRLNPEFAQAYNNRGACYYELNHLNKADEDFNRAIELTPNDFDFYNNRGELFNKLGKYEKANENFDMSLKLKPDHAKAYFNLGISYSQLKQQEKAIENFRMAIKLNPKLTEQYKNYGLIYYEIIQYKNANDNFNQVISS